MWNSQNNISLLLNVGRYRSVGSVVRIAYNIEGTTGVKLIKTCFQWIKGIDHALKERILSLPKLPYIPSELKTVEKVLPLFGNQHRDIWNLIPDDQKVCIQLCQELMKSDIKKIQRVLSLKKLASPSTELTNTALGLVSRKTGIPIHINKELTSGAPLVRQLLEENLVQDESKTADGEYIPHVFDE